MRRLFLAVPFLAGLLIPHAAWARQPNLKCNPDAAIAGVHITPDTPDLMAIGDSIYNGVESLSLVQAKTNFSPPNLVAGKLVHSFRIPQYGSFPLLIDLDVALRQSWTNILFKTGPQTVASISAYADPKNPHYPARQPQLFDNIAVAQADSTGLICDTAADGNWFVSQNYKPGAAAPVATGDLGMPGAIESWLYALNSSYVLNPTANHAYDNLSQLDEVLLRKPKMLLVNIGSNDGVWLMAFNGYTATTCYDPTDPDDAIVACSQKGRTTVAIELKDLEANMRFIAAKLKHFTPKTRVILNLLPRPSAAANLSPPLTADPAPPPGQHYFPVYENYVGTGGIHDVSGQDVAAMDNLVAAANQKIEKDVCAILTPQHVAFMDLYKLLTKYDYKNNPAVARLQVPLWRGDKLKEVSVDNRILKAGDKYIDQGGLFGYDNMHPTVFGYTLVANAVLSTINRFNAVSPNATDCVQGVDDTMTIDPQTVAGQINGPHPGSGIVTALTIDKSIYRFLGAVHDILKYESAQAGTASANLYQQTLQRFAMQLQGVSPTQAAKTGTMMHALFRMGHYPSGNRALHAAPPSQ